MSYMDKYIKETRKQLCEECFYGVMRNPKTTLSKSHVRMSPEIFLTKEQAQNYIDECRRRTFLQNDWLVIVEIKIIGGELNEKIL